MLRFKDYNATGIAPDGRLYAGDLNLLQDLVAALASYTQNLSVGSLAVGEAGLTISRYGAGEFTVAGLARVTGILRALNGFVSGTFSTAARNAISAGSRPYGLLIVNTTTNQYEWNKGTDAAPDWQPLTPAVAEVPVGGVMDWPWASGSIPAWSMLPYGQSIVKATYPVLDGIASASGYLYGSTAPNFSLPDYRGRIGVGKDDMGGSAANRITIAISGVSGATLGATFGAEGITLTTGMLPAHNHAITGAPGHSLTLPNHSHNTSITFYDVNTSVNAGPSFGSNGVNGANVQTFGSTNPLSLPAISGSITAGSLGTGNTGSGSAVPNTQPSIVVNKIMRVL